MDNQNLVKALEYYTLVGKKDAEGIKKFLDNNVEFSGPLATLKGKEAVVESTSNFMKTFKSLTIRAKFCDKDQAMIVYDVDVPGVNENFPGASLLTFKDGLIVKIQLFYDGSPFKEMQKKIFAKSST